MSASTFMLGSAFAAILGVISLSTTSFALLKKRQGVWKNNRDPQDRIQEKPKAGAEEVSALRSEEAAPNMALWPAAPSLSYDLFIPQHKVSILQIKCDTFMKLALLVTLAIATTVSATRAADREPVPVPASTASATLDFLRGVIFCNVQLVGGAPEAGLAIHVFNTSGLNNSDDRLNTCPAERWAKVSADALKAQYDVMAVLKNGPHGWTMDAITLPVGTVVGFNGLETRWWTMTKLPKGTSFDEGASRDLGYKPVPSRRSSTFTYQAGKPAFIIEDADGTPWVMQSFSRLIDPSLTYDSLQDLGRKLTLPKGWKYRVTVLSQDLQIKAPPGYNWIILDEFWNNYVACKGGACNFQP